VGPLRHHLHHHTRRRQLPKLIPAGRLAASIDGRPIDITTERDTLTLRFRPLRDALYARRRAPRGASSALRALPLRVHAKVPFLPSLRVAPSPNPLVRALLP